MPAEYQQSLIKRAMFDINGDKSPGHDWCNAAFFQKNWDILGNDIVDDVTYFLPKNAC